MSSLLSRIPFRESKKFIIASAIVFLALLTVRVTVDAPVKEEKAISKKKAEGRTIAPEAYVPVWLYKGLKMNLLISGAVLLASPWLGRRGKENAPMVSAPAISPVQRWEIIACIALMGLAAWHNAPRLYHSMWGDEEFNASRFMLDYVERDDAGNLEIKERSWVTTLWNMRKPTNHLGYSFFARLTHDTFFVKKTGPTDPWFSEALLRTPVFIAGLLLIPAFFWALRVWGLRPWWGLLLLLLHPWFTRFGVDGRGYGFIMLGTTVMLGVLGRALQTGYWRLWIAFGLLGFFIIWSNLQGVYTVTALNLLAFVCLLTSRLPWASRWLLASRWFVANMITLMLIVGYLAPCWPQLQEFLAKGEITGTLDGRFWQDGMCAWLFGQPFQPWDEPQNPLRYAMQLTWSSFGILVIPAVLLFSTLILLGLAALLRKRETRPLVVFTVGAPALMLLHMAMSHNRPYDWYFTPFIPGLFLMAACGAENILSVFQKKAVPLVILASSVALYGMVTAIPRTLLRDHPIEPSRDSVALYRKVTNPRNPDIDKGVLSGAFTMYTEGYDPALRRFNTANQLRELMDEADRTGKQLYINVGFLKFMRIKPETLPSCRIIEDPALFRHVATLPGLLPYTTRDVFLYKGKAP